MSDTNRKTFTPTSQAEVKRASISSLADRPNVVSRYGDGGLSAVQLKARFDALPELNRNKINEIIEALGSTEATKYITLGEFLADDNLYDFLTRMTTAEISDVFKALYAKDTDAESKAYTLNEIFSNIAYRLSVLKLQADGNTKDIKAANERIEAVETGLGEVLQGGKNININSIVIGEGEAADLSIAGGTISTKFFAAVINSNTELKEKIKEYPGGSNILKLLESGNISASTINTINSILGTNYTIVKSKADATMSISLGTSNESTEVGAVTFGYGNKSSGFSSSAFGSENTVTGSGALAYGYKNTVNGDFGVAFGEENTAGERALAGGILSEATGKGSFAFGNECEATGEYAVALGGDCVASGIRSFAEGTNTTASGKYSHAQNEETTASGESSTAEGYKTIASGNQAHAGGRETKASARNSTSFGFQTEAKHEQSFTTGRNLITGRDNQTVVGEWNEVDENALYVIGNGNGPRDRRNAFTVNKDGTATLNGAKILTRTPWVEMSDENQGYVFFNPGGVSDYEFFISASFESVTYRIMLGVMHFDSAYTSGFILGNVSAPIGANKVHLRYNTESRRLSAMVEVEGQSQMNTLSGYTLYCRLVHE